MIFESLKRFRAERADETAFLVASGDRSVPITWRQFTDDIAVIARIIEKYTPGRAIGILGENSYEWMVAHAACLFSGAVAVPIDLNLSPYEIARRLKFVDSPFLLHSALYNDKAQEVRRLARGIGTGGFGTRKTDRFLDEARSLIAQEGRTVFDRESVDLAKTATIVFTSGTTSEPCGVELSLGAIETFVQSTDRAIPMRPGDRSLMMLPLHHIFGIAVAYSMLAHGVTLGVCPDFRRLYDAVERFRANYIFLVPALADILATKIEHHGTSAEEALGTRIDWVLTGGAPLSRRTHDRLEALGIRSVAGYGLTETTACYSLARLDGAFVPGSAGQVSLADGVEFRVSDAGELLVRGPNVMKGYYGMPERTAEAIDSDGWFHTGDAGRIDERGFVWVTGRLSRTIVLSSGKKIAPEELEAKLQAIPGVLEVVVSGEGESRAITAEVYASLSEEAVRRAVAELNLTLPVYQRLTRVVLRSEPFPHTSSGKIRLGPAPAAEAEPVEPVVVRRGRTCGRFVAACILASFRIRRLIRSLRRRFGA